MNDRFRISSLLAGHLKEYRLDLRALLRRAELPPAFFQQEKIYATTAELFSLWRSPGELSKDPAGRNQPRRMAERASPLQNRSAGKLD